MCVCLFACLLACLLVCLFNCVCLFVCLILFVWFWLFVCLFVCLIVFVCLILLVWFCLFVCLFVCLLVCLFVCLIMLVWFWLFVCLFVCLFSTFLYISPPVCMHTNIPRKQRTVPVASRPFRIRKITENISVPGRNRLIKKEQAWLHPNSPTVFLPGSCQTFWWLMGWLFHKWVTTYQLLTNV